MTIASYHPKPLRPIDRIAEVANRLFLCGVAVSGTAAAVDAAKSLRPDPVSDVHLPNEGT